MNQETDPRECDAGADAKHGCRKEWDEGASPRGKCTTGGHQDRPRDHRKACDRQPHGRKINPRCGKREKDIENAEAEEGNMPKANKPARPCVIAAHKPILVKPEAQCETRDHPETDPYPPKGLVQNWKVSIH